MKLLGQVFKHRRLARCFIMLKPTKIKVELIQIANNKGADQTAWMRRLVGTFVVHAQQGPGFLH